MQRTVKALCLLLVAAAVIRGAAAHDTRQPDLDKWYGGLMRPKEPNRGCCSKIDCYTTQAELRADGWWAKLGQPDLRTGQRTLLSPMVHIPQDIILQHDNQAGEAVLCNEIDWTSDQPPKLDFEATVKHLFCFVPPNEY